SGALFDVRAVVADLDEVDTTAGDDLHVAMLSAKADRHAELRGPQPIDSQTGAPGPPERMAALVKAACCG
ncbi:hypothetical protein ACFRLW_33595, partial [Streptomyces sp. NPDC056728]